MLFTGVPGFVLTSNKYFFVSPRALVCVEARSRVHGCWQLACVEVGCFGLNLEELCLVAPTEAFPSPKDIAVTAGWVGRIYAVGDTAGFMDRCASLAGLHGYGCSLRTW